MDCIALLQWALPQLDLQWSGFRKVRRQVCKRLKRRITELQLDNFAAYRARLAVNPAEWIIFDQCCHITISRFFRDKGLFETVRRRVLPEIAVRAKREQRDARIWSAGCASGEEPYSLKILWDLEIADLFPEVSVSIIATDIDNTMLARAREGCFKATSLRDFPPHLLGQAFDHVGSLFCIRPRHRKAIEFLHQDLRLETPMSIFDLILCRYVAFTYFAPSLQNRILIQILDRLSPDGYLVIGAHERIAAVETPLLRLDDSPQIFRKSTYAR